MAMGSKKQRRNASGYKIGQLRDYEKATKKSRRLYDIASKLLPRGVESNFRVVDPYPFYISRGKGSRVWDVDGNEYLDFLLGQGVILLGHNHPAIRKAVTEQLKNGMTFALPTERVVEAARLVNQLFPSMEMLRFANSGTEATMHAIRVARGFTGKDKIAKSEGGYHGVHDQLLWSIWGPDELLGSKREPKPCIFSKGIPKVYSELVVPIIYNDLEGTEEILRKNAKDLAALIIEPVMGNAGCLLPKDNYLQETAKICKENDILFILDEVVTGFRLAPGGAQEIYGLRPDMTCLGKALGGGMPVAAFGGRREIMETIVPKYDKWPWCTFHGGTYNAHPVGLAAAIAALKIYKQGRFYAKLNRLSNDFFRGLTEITADLGYKAQVSHIGSMGFIYFKDTEVKDVRDTHTANWELVFKFAMEGVKRGVLFGHPKGEKLFLSASHTKEDIELALEIAEECLRILARK
jgi:glutamate-1-semialdehyde 2,1-aminomutase